MQTRCSDLGRVNRISMCSSADCFLLFPFEYLFKFVMVNLRPRYYFVNVVLLIKVASEYKDIEETNYINKDPQGEVTTNGITLRNTNLSSPNIARTNYSIYWKGDKTQ